MFLEYLESIFMQIPNIKVYVFCFVIGMMSIPSLLFMIMDFVVIKFGDIIHKEEVHMVVKDKGISNHINRVFGKVNYDFFVVLYDVKNRISKKMLVSEEEYNKININDTMKVYQIIYKYKGVYLKDIEKILNLDISNHNKIDENSNKNFLANKERILEKCRLYDKHKDKAIANIQITYYIFIIYAIINILLAILV